MDKRRELDRRAKLGKRLSIDDIIADQHREKYYTGKEQGEDTKIRREIQTFIINKFREGKSKEEVLKRVRFVYGSKRYAKYQPYFSTWVENHDRQNKRTDEGEER